MSFLLSLGSAIMLSLLAGGGLSQYLDHTDLLSDSELDIDDQLLGLGSSDENIDDSFPKLWKKSRSFYPVSYDVTGGSCSSRLDRRCRSPATEDCEVTIGRLESPGDYCRLTVNCTKSDSRWKRGTFCFALLNVFNLPNFPGLTPNSVEARIITKDENGAELLDRSFDHSNPSSLACSVHSLLARYHETLHSFYLSVKHDCSNVACSSRSVPGNAVGAACGV